MKTQLLKPSQVLQAAEIIKNGGLVALPTETVYGLGADAFNPLAIKKIFIAKGRPSDNPLIVHIAQFEELFDLVSDVKEPAKKLIETFWPGPLTVILPRLPHVPDEVTAGLNSVAVRMPSHPLMRRVIKLAETPIAAPSANLSGKPSPTKVSHVIDDMDGKIDAILDGGDCSVGLESTVISFMRATPQILRPGAITVEQIEGIIGAVEVDSAVLSPVKEGQTIESPGTKYKHYAPNAKVIILDCSREKFIDFVNANTNSEVAALCFDEDIRFLKVKSISFGKEIDEAMQANRFFDSLRKFDTLPNIKTIYARCPSKSGIGLAVYNRLIRAAGFEIKKL